MRKDVGEKNEKNGTEVAENGIEMEKIGREVGKEEEMGITVMGVGKGRGEWKGEERK